MRNILKVCVFMFVLSLSSFFGAAQAGVNIVEVTGRAALSDQYTFDELRRMALEDALYLAALQGEARVDGYSFIDEMTNLTEQVLVRPVDSILDYSLLEEKQTDHHFEVKIRAVTGHIDDTCSSSLKSRLHVYSPQINMARNAPSWAAGLAKKMVSILVDAIDKSENLEPVNQMYMTYDPVKAQRVGSAMDYNAIMTSSAVASGDFAVAPRVEIRQRKDNMGYLAKSKQLDIVVHVDVYDHLGVMVARESFPVTHRMGFEFYLDTVNMLTASSRDNLLAKFSEDFKHFVMNFGQEFSCRPVTGKLTLDQDNRLRVDFGVAKGVLKNHLAVVAENDASWTVFRVVEAQMNSVFLETLDKRQNNADFNGKTVRFMELGQ